MKYLFLFLALSFTIKIIPQERNPEILYKKTYPDQNNTSNFSGTYFNFEANVTRKYSALNIGGQLVTGSAAAVLFSLPASSGFSFGGNNSSNTQAVFIYSSYIIGAASGVWLIGKLENDKLSFWNVLASSAIGGCAGFLTYSAVRNEFYFPLLAAPILGAMVYTLFISD